MRYEMNRDGNVDIIAKRGNMEVIVATLEIEQMEELYEIMRKQEVEEKVNYLLSERGIEVSDDVYNSTVDCVITSMEWCLDDENVNKEIDWYINAEKEIEENAV